MRWFGRVVFYGTLIVAGIFAAFHFGSEWVTAYELRTTGAASQAELADDYGWPILLGLWMPPELFGGSASGVVTAWLLVRCFERVTGAPRGALSAYTDSFFLGLAVGLGLTAGVIALHIASGHSFATLDLLLLGPGTWVAARLMDPPSSLAFRWMFASVAISGLINGITGACFGLLAENLWRKTHHRAQA